MPPPASLVQAMATKELQAEREARLAAREAAREAERERRVALEQERAAEREAALEARELFARARRELPPKVKTPEQLEAERKKRRLQLRQAKGKPLAELPVRKAVVELKVEGWKHAEIASHLEIPESAVSRHLKAWQLSETPSEETTEQLRKIMLERLETMHHVYWRRMQGVQDPDTLEWIVEPDEKAAEVLLKVMDRASKLMGADLQPNALHLSISAESIAKFLGWDPDPGTAGVPASLPTPVLDLGPGEVVEETDE